MSSIILLSTIQASNTLHAVLKKIFPSVRQSIRVAIITTASAEWKENNRHAIQAKEFFHAEGFSYVDFVDVEHESADRLYDFHIVYISGGDPYFLLHHLKASGADETLRKLIQEGRLIIGVSAGGMVLGPDLQIACFSRVPSQYQAMFSERKGLGLLPFHVVYHSNRYPGLVNQARSVISGRVIELTDTQALFFKNGKIEYVGQD